MRAVQVCSDKCACGEQMWVNCKAWQGIGTESNHCRAGETLLPHPKRGPDVGDVVGIDLCVGVENYFLCARINGK